MVGSGDVGGLGTADGAELSLRLDAVPQNVARARHAVTARARDAGISGKLVDTIALAVSEAMTNAVVHGFQDHRDGQIDITAGVQPEGFVITVTDNGSGMLPRPDSPGLGLGLPIIAQLTASMDVRGNPAGAGTRITMTFA